LLFSSSLQPFFVLRSLSSRSKSELNILLLLLHMHTHIHKYRGKKKKKDLENKSTREQTTDPATKIAKTDVYRTRYLMMTWEEKIC